MEKIEELMLEEVSCPLGCLKNDEFVLSGADILNNLPGKFIVVRCRTCGLMRTNPRLVPESISKYYPDDYGPYVGTRVASEKIKSGFKLKKILKIIFGKIYDLKTSVIPNIKPGRMLEIGCASGSFLQYMAELGWHVQGIEFSEKAAQEAAKLGYFVHAGPLETAPDPNDAFDLIVGWMVLEHLYDPVHSLKKLREWSKPTSWLVLSVPNAGSMEFNFFKNKWYALQLPTHFHHFTPKTIENVLFAGGWKLEKIHHQRVISNLIASTGYMLRDKGLVDLGQKFINFPTNSTGLNYFLYPLSLLLSIFGQTGRMTVWARPIIEKEMR